MHASLVEKDTREDVLLIKDTRSKEDIHLFKDNRTKATTGSSVSSLYPLKDIEGNGQESGFFVFPDLSVRMEGTYRLKFCLYEMVGKDVHFCAHVISEPLVVFSAKKFPGMEESTVLSQYFADQGLKLRIRKEVRPKKYV
ncbi:MAG: velvet factor [Linnemannia gamsii]|nr:MAG: velvet factor [Linnemannia gamsii]